MKVLHVAAADLDGGAARAAYRIHAALRDNGPALGVDGRMRVIRKTSADPTVVGGPPQGWRWWRAPVQRRTGELARRGFQTPNPVVHSIAWPRTGLGREIRASGADIVHLHWLGDETLSVEEIGELDRPVVWSLHDPWALLGAEHYGPLPPDTDDRLKVGYRSDNRLAGESGPDICRWTWERKRRAWRSPHTLVCTSHWLRDLAARSQLTRAWPSVVVPYPLDPERFSPVDREVARAAIGLESSLRVIGFGAIRAGRDRRKGADLLVAALRRMHRQLSPAERAKVTLLVFGDERQHLPEDLPFSTRALGHLDDDLSLKLAYGAADVVVVPSRLEAYGQIASEAHACGRPVVAFAVGGLRDIIDHQTTGVLAAPFDVDALADGIRWVLDDASRRHMLGDAARRRAVAQWLPATIARRYAEVYAQVLEGR